MLLVHFIVPLYEVYGGCGGVYHSVQSMVITNCLIPPYGVNGRLMLSFLRYVGILILISCSTIQCSLSDVNIGAWHDKFTIPTGGVNDRFTLFGPTVHRAW